MLDPVELAADSIHMAARLSGTGMWRRMSGRAVFRAMPAFPKATAARRATLVGLKPAHAAGRSSLR
ncbi:hypothetical protein GCM10010211_71480 [Streptomyces albospinus]|uniref:Uncharacterized protein n=1 Tax=Streptomyces albospinus TaxID=285515 RepID=A0ABQ2VNR6_9ACTN|nr:hypothetical protein GCM10010211_71480 [Streptomyces albospinus]